MSTSSSRRRSTADPELRAATSAHYEDPAYYASTYADREEDVAYYVRLAKRIGGPVLEHGCGNGRITLPIARAGVRITGVDISAPMLADLRANLAKEDPAVRASLTPRGRFVFDVSMPQAEELARKPERAFSTPRFAYPGVGMVRYKERFDYEPLRQILFVSMEFEPVSGAPKFMTPLAHRQFFPAELEALFHYNGFRIDGIDGDFDGAATNESATLVYTTSVRRSRRI